MADEPKAKMVEFTAEKLARLKMAYKKAVADKVEAFTFEGDEWVVGYAKYAIEYLDGLFAKQR